MASNFELNATKRDTVGKSHAKRTRRLQGLMPAIIYGGNNKPTPININHNQILRVTKNEAFFSHILTLSIDGQKEQVVIKDIHRHPHRQEILHMDFLRIKAKEAITMKIPLHFIGEDIAPGVKDGGSVSHLMTEIEIKCLPKDLPEFINVDISKLELDQSIHLAELEVPEKTEIIQLTHGEENDLPVVSIHKVKAQPVEEISEVDSATDTEAEAGTPKTDTEQEKS